MTTFKRFLIKNFGNDFIYIDWILSLFLTIFLVKNTILSVPLVSHGDLIASYGLLQNLAGYNSDGVPDYGFPFGMNSFLLGWSELTQVSIVAILTILSNPIIGLNIYILLSYPAVLLISSLCLRNLGVHVIIRIFISTVITFLPWHLYRLDHWMYASTWPYVLMSFLVIKLLKDRGQYSNRLLIVVGALSLSGSYIGFYGLIATFTCYFLLLVTSTTFLKKFLILKLYFKLLAFQFILYFIVVLPNVYISYFSEVFLEVPYERSLSNNVESAGSLANLLLPSTETRLPVVRNFVKKVFAGQNSNESFQASNSLSLTAFVVIIIFLVMLILISSNKYQLRFLNLNTYFMVIILLWFVPYGLNYVFASTVTTQFRSWNRLAPLLQIHILILFGLYFTKIIRLYKIYSSKKNSKVYHSKLLQLPIYACFVLLFFDQVKPIITENGVFYQESAIKKYEEMKNYTDSINKSRTAGCGTLQLPILGFPEFPAPNSMRDYDQLWPSLVDSKFNGSYGVIKFTYEDSWREIELDQKNTQDIRSLLIKYGFCGVDIDFYGYSEIPQWLVNLIADSESMIYSKSGRNGYIPLVRNAIRNSDISLLLSEKFVIGKGFSAKEQLGNSEWYWAIEESTYFLIKSAGREEKELRFVIEGNSCEDIPIEIKHDDTKFKSTTIKKNEQKVVNIRFVSGGKYTITSKSKPCFTGEDPRPLMYRIYKPEIISKT